MFEAVFSEPLGVVAGLTAARLVALGVIGYLLCRSVTGLIDSLNEKNGATLEGHWGGFGGTGMGWTINRSLVLLILSAVLAVTFSVTAAFGPSPASKQSEKSERKHRQRTPPRRADGVVSWGRP